MGICVRMFIFEGYMGMGVSGWCKREWAGIWMMYVFDSVDVSVLCV